MVSEPLSVSAQAQTVQRVQVVDAAEGRAILGFGDLAEVRSITIASDGASPTTVTLDLASFGSAKAPRVSFSGDGADAVAVKAESQGGGLDWQVTGDGSGGIAGLGLRFTGVSRIGGGGNDTLHGPAPGRAA